MQTEARTPSLHSLAWVSVIAIYLQLILGSLFRHHGMNLLPHLLLAVVVSVIVLWTSLRTISRHAALPQLRRPAALMPGLLIVQLGLGFVSYLARVAPVSERTASALVAATVGHVSVGALLLATALVLAIQSGRYLTVSQAPASGSQRAATA